MVDTPFATVDRNNNPVSLPTAQLIADTLVTLQADLGAKLTSIDARVDGMEAFSAAGNATLTAIDGRVDGLEALVAATNTKLDALGTKIDATNTSLNDTTTPAAVTATQLPSTIGQKAATNSLSIVESSTQSIGTRAYGATQRIAVATTSTSTGAIVTLPKGEVMLQADTDCFIKIGTGGGAVTADAATSIPLVAGEKFHLQASTGQFIAVIRKTADGFLYITPVA
ncbi:MAG TPA: hypothetical protein VF637_05845 [Sphingomicrobium sp.]